MRVVGLSLAIATLLWTFRDTEPQRVASLLERVGGAGLLLLVPQLLALMVESAGWQLAFRRMGSWLPYGGLLRARLGTEALAQTLPLGVLFCESLKPALLARNCGADLSTSLAGMAARKWLLIGSQSLYVGGFAVLSWAMLVRVSPSLLHSAALPWLLLTAALVLLLLTLAGVAALSRGRIVERAYALLLALPFERLRKRLELARAEVARTDGRIRAFIVSVLSSPAPLLLFLAGWLLEACETYLILRLLGVELSWTSVGALEVSASLLRNLAVMVPAGLGIQDLSYLAFLRALGVPDALNVAAAFLLLKRTKELFWAAFGYVVLAIDLRAVAPLSKPLEQT
jgi:hypothetical protein